VSVQAYLYDSYGQIKTEVGLVANPYTYTGREFDEESGLLYYRSRYYDPRIGRFSSEDPVGFLSGDVNFYSYVFNNPVNLVDPSGEFIFTGTALLLGGGIALTAAESAFFLVVDLFIGASIVAAVLDFGNSMEFRGRQDKPVQAGKGQPGSACFKPTPPPRRPPDPRLDLRQPIGAEILRRSVTSAAEAEAALQGTILVNIFKVLRWLPLLASHSPRQAVPPQQPEFRNTR